MDSPPVGRLCDLAKVGELMELETQLDLFAPGQSQGEQPEPDSRDEPKPGAFWNGKIWVTNDDLPEGF